MSAYESRARPSNRTAPVQSLIAEARLLLAGAPPFDFSGAVPSQAEIDQRARQLRESPVRPALDRLRAYLAVGLATFALGVVGFVYLLASVVLLGWDEPYQLVLLGLAPVVLGWGGGRLDKAQSACLDVMCQINDELAGLSPITEVHAEAVLMDSNATAEGRAYRQAVLSLGRAFVVAEFDLLRKWALEAPRRAALVELYRSPPPAATVAPETLACPAP